MSTFSYLVDAVNRSYHKLSTREKVLADAFLLNPSLIILHSASQLAEVTGVSNSTVTRFVKRIGYEKYEDVRANARKVLGDGSPLTLINSENPNELTPGRDFLTQFLTSEEAILQAAFASLSPEKVEDIACHLAAAPNLGFLGFRNSHYFAAYAQWQFIQFRGSTRLLSRSGETVAEHIADLGEGDVVVAIGVRRLVQGFQRYLEAITKTGAEVLLITDPSQRQLASSAKWSIVCPVENDNAFDSYAGVLSIIRLLAFKSFLAAGETGKDYMHSIEEQHVLLSEFE